jgi:uncharacterized protein YcgL (UPF0745 family)
MQCSVYKSHRQSDYFLFVSREEGLSRLPDGLKRLLGRLEKVMDLELHPRRLLAQADARQVMRQIAECGYYLQMPPRNGFDLLDS